MPLYNPAGAGTVADGSITSAKIADGTIAVADMSVGLDARYAQVANNLSDVTAATARTNLSLGSLATLSTITTSEITDGTIAVADMSAAALVGRNVFLAITYQ